MKKLLNISNQIKNNTYSYTGKGSFEAVVNNFKSDIIIWLEELVPLQQQIQHLFDKSSLQLQKRNYTRILTKLLPDEYKEFVSLNILVRDANKIASCYKTEFNVTLLYDKLILNKDLKYPGKYEKFVEFEIFQKFIMMYRDELVSSLGNETNKYTKQQVEKQPSAKIEKQEDQPHNENKEILPTKDDTNWTNLLLGGN